MPKQLSPAFPVWIALAVITMTSSLALAADPIPRPVLLWSNGAPGATGNSEEDQPAIFPYLPAPDKNTGAAILVAPGGGFTKRCMDYEGTLFAEWFKARGIAAFILRYRLTPLYTRNDAVTDAHRGLQFLRAHAGEYKISPDRIGMIGFPAGSELEAMTLFRAQSGKPDAEDPLDRQFNGLNFAILGYGSSPVPQSYQMNRSNTPPTFFFCTTEDRGHATGMLKLYTDMYNAGVPAEIHLFPNGEHGVGLAQGDAVLGVWPELMYNWIRAQNLLTTSERVALSGHVKLDGKPLPHGSITFIPVGELGAAPVTAYIMNTDTDTADYKFAKSTGPIPGKYRVEIRQDAVTWVSNNRNPFARSPFAERAAAMRVPGWGEPTIEDVRVFTKTHPKGKDLTAEIKPGDTRLDVEVFSK